MDAWEAEVLRIAAEYRSACAAMPDLWRAVFVSRMANMDTPASALRKNEVFRAHREGSERCARAHRELVRIASCGILETGAAE